MSARNRAETRPDHPDPRLRGAAFAVPFERVWQAVIATAEARRWSITSTDPSAGELTAEARSSLWKFVDDVRVRVWLDEEGRTRVDLASASRVGRWDLGANRRRIQRFLRRLEKRLYRR